MKFCKLALSSVFFSLSAFATTPAPTTATHLQFDNETGTQAVRMGLSMHAVSIGPMTMSQSTGTFVADVTPLSNDSSVIFSATPQGDIADKCEFDGSFDANANLVLTPVARGNAQCWVTPVSTNSYVMHMKLA